MGVTAIIPTRNRCDELAGAVRSALRQRPVIAEVIVVDDGSSDETGVILANFADSITPIRGTGAGVCNARNLGLARATHPWVVFLDDDDRLTEDWGSSVSPFLDEPDLGLICGGAVLVGSASTTVDAQALGPQYNGIVGCTLAGTWLARRDVLASIGGYAEELRHSENIELFLRLATALRRSNLRSTSIERTLASIRSSVPSTARGSTNNLAKLDATRWLLAEHLAQLELLPEGLAALLRAGGVAGARVGEYRQARRWFLQASRTGDRRAFDLARAVVASAPPVARKVWGLDTHSLNGPSPTDQA